jgi:hypothetical protein
MDDCDDIFSRSTHIGTTSNASRRCDFVCRSLRKQNFDDTIQSTRRELRAAQYLSENYAAYGFVSRQ